MPIALNFLLASMNFLWRDQPIVIKTIAIMFINGCSTASNLAAEFKPPIPSVLIADNPLDETKNKIRPKTNWICESIRVKRLILKSFSNVNILLLIKPVIALATARKRIARTT